MRWPTLQSNQVWLWGAVGLGERSAHRGCLHFSATRQGLCFSLPVTSQHCLLCCWCSWAKLEYAIQTGFVFFKSMAPASVPACFVLSCALKSVSHGIVNILPSVLLPFKVFKKQMDRLYFSEQTLRLATACEKDHSQIP